MKKKTVTVKEACAYHNLSKQRIIELCNKGRIPGAFFVGRMWFLPDPPVISEGVMGRPRKR